MKRPEQVVVLRGIGMPPVRRQVQALVRHAAQVMVHGWRTGVVWAPTGEVERRRQICLACDQWVDGRCAECGCVGRWKTLVAAGLCRKWEEREETYA